MEEEIWREIEGYKNLYQVSNLGRVKSLNYRRSGKEQILKPKTDRYGYLSVHLCKEGKPKDFKLHRLVAEAFLSNPHNYPQVNHLDENKRLNSVENLEWCTNEYNVNYGTRNERAGKKISVALTGRKHSEETKMKMAAKMTNGKCSKPVLQLNKITNEVVAEFPSVMEVQRQLGFNNGHISDCCNRKRKSCGGFKWQFKNEC